MNRRLAAFLLVPVLAATPASAQKAATGATVPKPSGIPPATAASPAKASAMKASAMKASNEAEMLKAQKAAAARDKAWDVRTRNSMTSICKGC